MIWLDKLLGRATTRGSAETPAEVTKHNQRLWQRFAAANPLPNYFFCYEVAYERDGASGVIGVDARDPRLAAEAFEDRFGGAARITSLRYIDYDHNSLATDAWITVPKRAAMQRGRGFDAIVATPPESFTRENARTWRDFTSRNRKPDYYYCFEVRYERNGAYGVIGIDERDPEAAAAKFQRRFGGQTRVAEIRYIDYDHNALAADNWA